MDNLRGYTAEVITPQPLDRSKNKKSTAEVLIITIIMIIVFSAATIPITADIIRAIRYEREAQEYFENAFYTQGDVFETNEDARRYLEEQILNDENGWTATSDQDTVWTKDISIITTDDVDNEFIFDAFGEATDGSLCNTDAICKCDYIRGAFFSDIDYDISIEYGLDRWDITIESPVSPSDQRKINETSQMIADRATGSDAEKVICISDSIADMLTYQLLDDPNIYAAISSGEGKCYHYAEIFYLACIDAGIDAHVITGDANGGGHAWDIVKIDGKWYHADPTWQDGDPNGNWLLLGDDEISKTHTVNDCYRIYEETCPYSESNYYS